MILCIPSLGGMRTDRLGLGPEQEDSEQFKSSMYFGHVVHGYLHKSNILLHSDNFIFKKKLPGFWLLPAKARLKISRFGPWVQSAPNSSVAHSLPYDTFWVSGCCYGTFCSGELKVSLYGAQVSLEQEWMIE